MRRREEGDDDDDELTRKEESVRATAKGQAFLPGSWNSGFSPKREECSTKKIRFFYPQRKKIGFLLSGEQETSGTDVLDRAFCFCARVRRHPMWSPA